MANAVEVFRESLKGLPQVAAHSAVNTPDLRSIFTPKSHEQALDPNCEVIVGDRGVGKSFWSSVLKDDAARTAIAPIYPKPKLEKVQVRLGFSEALSRPEHPSERVIASLLADFSDPAIIWRTVIVNGVTKPFLSVKWENLKWKEKCLWIQNNAEKEEEILSRFNKKLKEDDKTHLIIFDALDRLGKDWHSIRALSRSLLTTALQLRSFERIRAKLFVRPDMESDREIWSFRDGSKLKQNIVNLNWHVKDLYGFVWHWFLSDPDVRAEFAKLISKDPKVKIPPSSSENLIKVPDFLLDDENVQKRIVEKLSGKMMGAGSKKGHPYTWIPKHLADANERVSLRSFIIALRDAARTTPMSSKYAMAHSQIKNGVQQASKNRVEQLKEDYAWIEDVLKPLRGLSTPNGDKEFVTRWKEDKTIRKILAAKANDKDFLVPVEIEDLQEGDPEIYQH
ncbi:MAG TPA: hypothetical protein VIJ14_06805, partial [Rhabdochlamydiaceae bacterium]